MELDLITKQQEGLDTADLQKKVFDLKNKLSGRSLSNQQNIRFAQQAQRGRGRFATSLNRHLLYKNNLSDQSSAKRLSKFPKNVVDHRPTRLLVSGYDIDDQKAVVQHFQHFGDLLDYALDATVPSITLTYKTRKEAELTLLKGKHFQDRTLSITWCTQQQRVSRTTVLMSESEEDQLIDQSLWEGDEELSPEISEEVLLQDDEEEDEENEDRSWRR